MIIRIVSVDCFIPECEECNTDGSQCNKCSKDYFFIDQEQNSKTYGKCVSCQQHCLRCKEISKCEECEPGYGKNEKGECVSCYDKNCKSCNEDYTKCNKCQDSKYQEFVIEKGKCVTCRVNNCHSCNKFDPNKCEECEKGFHVNEQFQCERCEIENCGECHQNNKTCEECISGYYLRDNRCYKCHASNCKTCSEGNQYCDECEYGYIFDLSQGSNNYGKCIPLGISNCESSPYYNPNKCSSCIDNYILNEDKTKCEMKKTQQTPKNKKKLSGGAIAGIVIACLIIVGLCIILAIYFLIIKKKAIDNSNSV